MHIQFTPCYVIRTFVVAQFASTAADVLVFEVALVGTRLHWSHAVENTTRAVPVQNVVHVYAGLYGLMGGA